MLFGVIGVRDDGIDSCCLLNSKANRIFCKAYGEGIIRHVQRRNHTVMHSTFRSALIAAAFAVAGGSSINVANAAEVLKSGTFAGVSGHKSSGRVEIVKDGDVVKVVLKDDFTLQNAPTPRLAWGKDGCKRGAIFGALNRFKGMQEYTVPAGTDLGQFNEFWIWCERYDVGLAVAKLQ